MDLFSSTKICAKDHSSAQKAENKKPRRSEVFISMVTGGSRKTLYYVNIKVYDPLQFAQFKIGFSLS